MKQVERISVGELKQMAEKMFGNFVKADVDVEQKIIVVDAELHADMEAFMLENGSKQEDLWGINLHPEDYGTDDFVEFDSMINIRPRQGNRSRYVEDAGLREQILAIVGEVVSE
ncbi:DUF5674 family protein [Candidatus Saccharibacteria bacterium]|nr:DUF5674 family protein [Candidatus Saccharibacteria bacterium]